MVYVSIVTPDCEKLFFKLNKDATELDFLEDTAGPIRKKPLVLVLNRTELGYFLKEIRNWNNMRMLLNKIDKNIVIKVKPTENEYISYKWNSIASATVWEKVETENALSWLSTLGGGFSALGENFTHCAETAAKISLQQLFIGIKIGDPFLQARCKLFYSISLLQQNRLKLAKMIIRDQYRFAKSQGDIDERLINMCKGIWLKLRYCYALKNKLSL